MKRLRYKEASFVDNGSVDFRSTVEKNTTNTMFNIDGSTKYMLDLEGTSPQTQRQFNNLSMIPGLRQRENTLSSQISDMSSIPGNNTFLWPVTDPATSNLLATENTEADGPNSNLGTLIRSMTNELIDSSHSSLNKNIGYDENNITNTTGNLDVKRRAQSINYHMFDGPKLQNNERRRANTTFVPIQQQQDVTLLLDNVDPMSLNWVSASPAVPSANRVGNLGPTNTILFTNIFPVPQHSLQAQPMVPAPITSASLASLCSKFGHVISSRILGGLEFPLALVEFNSIEAAIHTMENLQGRDLSGAGVPTILAFAKILPGYVQQQPQLPPVTNSFPIAQTSDNAPHSLLQEQLYNMNNNNSHGFIPQGNVLQLSGFPTQTRGQSHPMHMTTNGNHSAMHIKATEKEKCPFHLPPPPFKDNQMLFQQIISSFNVDYDQVQVNHILMNALESKTRTSDPNNYGPLPTPLLNREFDTPRLREIRKNIDSNSLTTIEIEQLAITMLDEIPELSSDYLGNTIIQKLYDNSSDIIREIILQKTAKYLCSIGVHKNGTWVCQKMIKMAQTPRKMQIITDGIQDYCTPLFNDQFGNYVIQCVLKFGFPWNTFIFENIIDNFWTIAQNRYGARAIRACLETQDVITQEQSLVISTMIILYGEYLAVDDNGTLLISWLLDTSPLPNKHVILTQKLIPHLKSLCCHKLGSLTVLKLLNYRGSDSAKNLILETVFGKVDNNGIHESPSILIELLNDSNYGPNFVYKTLISRVFDGNAKHHIIRQVHDLLLEINPTHQHRRLMEEVGLIPMNHQGYQTRAHKSFSQVMDHAGNIRTGSISSIRSGNSILSQGQPPTSQPILNSYNGDNGSQNILNPYNSNTMPHNGGIPPQGYYQGTTTNNIPGLNFGGKGYNGVYQMPLNDTNNFNNNNNFGNTFEIPNAVNASNLPVPNVPSTLNRTTSNSTTGTNGTRYSMFGYY